MGAVGGSRHYVGGGLGQEGIWGCPSCGADNTGPIAGGCTVCGAGKPGRHIGHAPPPPPATPEPPEPSVEPEGAEQLGVFDRWALAHPQATLEEAFAAGYGEGIRAARRAQVTAAPVQAVAFTPEHVINRTLVAALELFRDQVLAGNPEEVTTGEWLSAQQVTGLIQQIQGEVVHG